MLKNIAVVGMAVMGKNLALNLADHGYSVLVYNRTTETTRQVISESKHPNLFLSETLEDMVSRLEKPRKILLMVKAGSAVDALLNQLESLLEKGDIVIDAGNSFYQDTIRREAAYASKSLNFVGMGVSGGEEGARTGPAIMPGGSLEAYKALKPLLEAIAAKVNHEPCVSYIGANGAGHYVKMVHNGIEYGDMQLIAESYSILRSLGHFNNQSLSEIYSHYNQGDLNSYLIEITADIMKKKDDLSSAYLLDVILDSAGQKGTGLWTSKDALDLGVNVSVITSAVNSRLISAQRKTRIEANQILPKENYPKIDAKELIDQVELALYAAKIISYAQGFDLMHQAALAYKWDLDYKSIAKIFRGGCIIRAQFLNKIALAYENKSDLDNLLLDPFFTSVLEKALNSLRTIVSMSVLSGIPIPAFSIALAYYDAFRSINLATNLIQAQRDYFGAHTYERTDREGVFHTNWQDNEK